MSMSNRAPAQVLRCLPDEKRQHVRKCCGRLVGLMRDIAEAQAITGRSGELPEPWAEEAQKQAVAVYRRTLPSDYQHRVASEFGRAATILKTTYMPTRKGRTGRQPGIVSQYFESVANAISATLGEPEYESSAGSLLGDRSPAVIRVDELASLYRGDGVETLRRAGEIVLDELEVSQHPELSTEQASWLRDLADGHRVVDVAVKHNLSERALYRGLNEVWSLLGVQNRAQGIALAGELGLLDFPAN